jgi:hypothetical protein
VQIEKQVSFRGSVQPFSNTYYYDAAVALDPPESAVGYVNDLLDDLIPLDRGIHGNTVTYTMARAWSQIGTKEQNQMIVQRPLSGTGTINSSLANLDPERAWLVQFRAGVDSRGRAVYLRKWLHLNIATLGGTNIGSAELAQTSQLPTAHKTAIEAWGESIKTLTPGAGPNAVLKAKSGRGITGATKAHPWLEHHQLGDQWRGT